MMTTKTTILIVDDENPIRELLRLYFEKEQFEVLEAENGAQAMTIFEEKKTRYYHFRYHDANHGWS